MKSERVRILLVEDNRAHALLVQRNIRNSSRPPEIHHVVDGEEALDYLERTCVENELPDLVLLDLRLPKLDGFTVLRKMRDDEKLASLPVVVLSTSDREADVKYAYECGAADYVVKPFNSRKLTQIIETLQCSRTKGSRDGTAASENLVDVLLVEDDESHIRLIKRAFLTSNEPVRLRCVRSLMELRTQLMCRRPDIVILDYLLPDGRSVDFLRAHLQRSHVPTVLVTGYADEHVIGEALQAGVYNCVQKSMDGIARLPAVVRQVLDGIDAPMGSPQ